MDKNNDNFSFNAVDFLRELYRSETAASAPTPTIPVLKAAMTEKEIDRLGMIHELKWLQMRCHQITNELMKSSLCGRCRKNSLFSVQCSDQGYEVTECNQFMEIVC